MCNVTVTWLNGDTRNCRIGTKHFNDKDWIVLVREYDHDYVIDVSSIRNLWPEKEDPKCLRIITETNLLDVSFADSRQAAAWLTEIKDLQANVKTIEKPQEVQPRQTKEVSVKWTVDNNISTAKDALAWTILHGGFFAAKTALTTGAVAAGFIDRCAANNLSKTISKLSPQYKERAWKHYKRTGSIIEMIEVALGTDL